MNRMRLGFGDRAHQGANPYARMRYLEAVSRCVPEALVDLVKQSPDHVDDWAQRWGFSDAWALQCARHHAQYWRDEPDRIGRWLVVSTNAWEPIMPAAPSWDAVLESEADFRSRVDTYIATIKDAHGLTKTPEKRGGDLHFEWLALHHVAEWTLQAIAAKYDEKDRAVNIGSISEAITKTVDLVGVTPRPRPGRRS